MTGKKVSKPVAAHADPTEQAVLEAVRRIPRGRVSTYGEIAKVAGLPRRARLVGTILRHTAAKVPWHRVINASGRSSFAPGSDACQRQLSLLKREGVQVRRDRIDLARFGWPDREIDIDALLWKRQG